MIKRREEKKQQSYQSLYQTALVLFEEYGFDKVSVAQIVRQSGVAKGTFFNYFPNKTDILAHWFDSIMSKAIEQPIPTGRSLKEKILFLAKHTLEAAQKQPKLWQAKNSYAGQSEAIQIIEQRIDQAIQSQIEQFLSESYPNQCNDSRQLAELIVTLMTGAVVEANRKGQSNKTLELFEKRLSKLLSLISS